MIKTTISCMCGHEAVHLGGHWKKCEKYKLHLEDLRSKASLYIFNYYKECLNVSECCKYIISKEGTLLGESAIRKHIVNPILKGAGVFKTFGDTEFEKFRQAKLKSAMMSKYGVVNNSQRQNQGYKRLNKIPYIKTQFSEDLVAYRKQCDAYTFKKLKKDKKSGSLPSRCEYTNIEFADIKGETNPNDPYKRTLDHRVPITIAYLNDWSVERVSDDSNLVYCLRIINNIKSTMDEDTFKRDILPKLKLKLLNENKQD